jgi:hypothetical protein
LAWAVIRIKEMLTFVKISRRMVRRWKQCFTKEGRTLAKINILILLLNCSNGENQRSGTFLKMTHYIPENNVYVYFRYTDNKTVILMNNSNEIQTIKTARFQESKHNRKRYFKRSDFQHFEIILEPKSVVILELK